MTCVPLSFCPQTLSISFQLIWGQLLPWHTLLQRSLLVLIALLVGWEGRSPPCPGSSVGGQSGSCLPSGCSAGSCPEVPSQWQQPCAHTAMFRSRDSLSLAALVRKHLLCSLLVLCALWMLRAPLGLVCDPCCTA